MGQDCIPRRIFNPAMGGRNEYRLYWTWRELAFAAGRLPEMSFVCVIPSRSLAGWATTGGSFPSSALVPLHAWISCLEIILRFGYGKLTQVAV